MRLRDVELDVAQLLEAAGLGNTTSTPPTLYVGAFPASAPDAFIACRQPSAEQPEKYLSGSGLAKHTSTVTVLVRGPRGPVGYSTSGASARAAWEVLYDAHPVGYVHVAAEDGGPTYLGPDGDGRHQWSLGVEAVYFSRG